MCEHYIARAAEPFRLHELWPFTAKLERFGIAGFGWGAAWLGDDGRLHSHRDMRAFCDDPAGRFSFSHNGDLRDYRALRATYREQGRIHGRADTEVGARWLEDAWRPDEPAAHLLAALHDRFGGNANLAVLAADGTPHHYAGNGENPVFAFRLGSIGLASTGIYSLDRSLFRFVAPSSTDRRLVGVRATVTLGRNGEALTAS